MIYYRLGAHLNMRHTEFPATPSTVSLDKMAFCMQRRGWKPEPMVTSGTFER